MAFDYCRAVRDVIKVTVREHQQIHPFAGEGGIGTLRWVEKDAPARCPVVKTVGIEQALK
jgi:hypothetical protein